MKQIFNRKKKTLVTVVALLTAFGITGTTLAVLQHTTGMITNTFRVEPVESKIEENIGAELQKEPYVTNTSDITDCLVRMSITVTPSDAPVNWFNTTIDKVTDQKTSTYNTEAWDYNESDGYFYYKGILTPGVSTEPLFYSYQYNGGDYTDFEEFQIILYQESIQVRAQDIEGNSIDAAEAEDGYNEENAAKLWKIYDDASKAGN